VAPPFDTSGARAEHEEIAASVVTDGYRAIRKGAPLPSLACRADHVVRGPCDCAAIAVVPDGVQNERRPAEGQPLRAPGGGEPAGVHFGEPAPRRERIRAPHLMQL
jgi:hypothetical protein